MRREEDRLEKYTPYLICLAVVYLIARNVIAAGSKPLGYDEVCTFAVTSQANAKAMWVVLSRAVDGHPIGRGGADR